MSEKPTRGRNFCVGQKASPRDPIGAGGGVGAGEFTGCDGGSPGLSASVGSLCDLGAWGAGQEGEHRGCNKHRPVSGKAAWRSGKFHETGLPGTSARYSVKLSAVGRSEEQWQTPPWAHFTCPIPHCISTLNSSSCHDPQESEITERAGTMFSNPQPLSHGRLGRAGRPLNLAAVAAKQVPRPQTPAASVPEGPSQQGV